MRQFTVQTRLSNSYSLSQVTSVLGLPSSIVVPGFVMTKSLLPQVISVLGLPSSIVGPGLMSMRSRLPQVMTVEGLPSSTVDPDCVSMSCAYRGYYHVRNREKKARYLWLSHGESVGQSRHDSEDKNSVAHRVGLGVGSYGKTGAAHGRKRPTRFIYLVARPAEVRKTRSKLLDSRVNRDAWVW